MAPPIICLFVFVPTKINVHKPPPVPPLYILLM
jgi:hypothetical protein